MRRADLIREVIGLVTATLDVDDDTGDEALPRAFLAASPAPLDELCLELAAMAAGLLEAAEALYGDDPGEVLRTVAVFADEAPEVGEGHSPDVKGDR